jgi:hypothetical protein
VLSAAIRLAAISPGCSSSLMRHPSASVDIERQAPMADVMHGTACARSSSAGVPSVELRRRPPPPCCR